MNLFERLYAGGAATLNDLPLKPAQPQSDKHHLNAAIDWLCQSQDVTDNGGSAATYNLVLGWEDAYPETTGYIIPTMLSCATATERPELADRAIEMADWLCEVQHEQGSFPAGTGATGDPNVFNTGQIIMGLTDAYEQTGESRYRSAVRRACDWLVKQQTPDGYWDSLDYNNEVHTYSTRTAWALLQGGAILPDKEDVYSEAARRNFEWATDRQRGNGWFEKSGFKPDEAPYLHTIAYTVRGLLEGGLLLSDSAIVDSAKRTADELLSIQEGNGVLKGAYDDSWSPAWYYCLTGNAQMAIIWLRLYSHTGQRQYQFAARRTIEFLKRRQVLEGPPQIRGGLAGSYPLIGRYMYLRFPNWASKFFIDALLLARDSSIDRPPNETEPDSVPGSGRCRVCLLCDGETVERWAAEAITEMLERTNAEISLVVSNEAAGLLNPENIKRGRKYPSYALYWLGNGLVDSVRSGKKYKQPVDVKSLPGAAEARWIRTFPSNVDGLWSELPDEVVEEIAASSDLVVRRGFGLITGDILQATKYGVLSYHHGDPRAYRGGPAGFWEYMNDERTAGMMVQLLSEDLDGGTVLSYDEIDITGCTSWGEVRERLYNSSTGLLAEAVENVQQGGEDRLNSDRLGEVHNPPSAREIAQYLWKRNS